MIEQRLNYIHNNPVGAYMVANAEDDIYSSARDYCGEKGLVKLCTIDCSAWPRDAALPSANPFLNKFFGRSEREME